ncbi:hypothetical protein S40293_09208 [Stachybotrys chartarum IBT 40293]|nr:hypothetical protein S40293_09208 [Stachybotrys chartarum IBT 40293]
MKPHPPAPLPSSNPTSSYWLSQPDTNLQDIGRHDKIPSFADTIIIGSGITGALIAHELQKSMKLDQNGNTIMLEARSLCSGATGRNGGHIKPDCYKNFARYEIQYGSEMAKKMCQFEIDNRKETIRFIKEQNLVSAAELIETRAVDFFMDKEAWKVAKHSLARYTAAGGDFNDIMTHDQPNAEKVYRFQGAHGAVSYPACTLWPYKLVIALIRKAISVGLKVFTHTAALDIIPAGTQGEWLIRTGKGAIRCRRIFHATNGYLSHLLPEYAGKLVPLKGTVTAIQPNPLYLEKPLGHSAGVQWGIDFDYMIQRESDGNPLVFGGRDLAHPRGLPGVIGDADDSVVTPEIVEALQQFPADHMSGWDRHNAHLRYAWSGIMGFTADELPFVGPVPGKPGQYMAAGYAGHGMARVFLTVKGLMQAVRGETIDSRIPELYFDVKKRKDQYNEEWEDLLHKAQKANQATEYL